MSIKCFPMKYVVLNVENSSRPPNFFEIFCFEFLSTKLFSRKQLLSIIFHLFGLGAILLVQSTYSKLCYFEKEIFLMEFHKRYKHSLTKLCICKNLYVNSCLNELKKAENSQTYEYNTMFSINNKY